MFGFGGCQKRGGDSSGHKFGACGPGALLADLNLTDEQVERVAELKLQGLAQFAQMKLSFGETFKRLCHELLSDNVDRNKVKAIFEEVKNKKAEAGDAFANRIISFAEVLTVEQRRKLKAGLLRKFLGLDAQVQGS